MSRFITTSPEETRQLAKRLAKGLTGGELILFRGGLGVGKTTFCAGLAAELGCIDAVSSPTFAIVNMYRGPIPFAHFDAYRITCADDLETSGFYDYLDQGAVVAVEWSENIEQWVSPPYIEIEIASAGGTEEREFTIKGAPWL